MMIGSDSSRQQESLYFAAREADAPRVSGFTGVCFIAFSFSLLLGSWNSSTTADDQRVQLVQAKDELRVSIGSQLVARYVYRDDLIPRPYLCDVCTLDGTQVTRNHPPRDVEDLTDHPTYHPGIWMAFGELGGADFWRNKAQVRQVEFIKVSQTAAEQGGFTVRNRYETEDGPVCDEVCRIEFVPFEFGYYLLWESRFTPSGETVAFGDQEEMGLGVRLATNLIVKRGGHVLNSHGDRDEAGAWGKQAAWCDYSRTMGDRQLGVLVMPHPDNFRESWFHVRDYGLLLANPFGRNAFTGKSKSRVVVGREKPLTLKFGVCVHATSTGDEAADCSTMYANYLKLTAAQ